MRKNGGKLGRNRDNAGREKKNTFILKEKEILCSLMLFKEREESIQRTRKTHGDYKYDRKKIQGESWKIN